MSTTTEAKPWDLSHVLDLVNSLSFASNDSQEDNLESRRQPADSEKRALNIEDSLKTGVDGCSEKGQNGLGDFSKLWHYLGSPPSSVSLVADISLPLESEKPSHGNVIEAGSQSTHKDTEVSNPMFVVKSKAERSSHSSTEEQPADTASDGSIDVEAPSLTKTQRKKLRRRLRRAQEAALAEERAAKKTTEQKSTEIVIESEAEVATPMKQAIKPAPEAPSKRKYNFRPRDASGKAKTSNTNALIEAASVAAQKVEEAKQANSKAANAQTHTTTKNVSLSDDQSVQAKHISAKAHVPVSYDGNISADDTLLAHGTPPASVPTKVKVLNLVPASVQPPAYASPLQNRTKADRNTISGTRSHVIAPMTIRSGADRHWALLMKLIGNFYEDRNHLVSPMNLTTHNNDPKGIHVFVDASNIFIGFADQLKRAQHIPLDAQVPNVNLSFDALALLMERRRPVAKRVLAGSNPWLPAFDKAKAVGYECNILEKVYKARELTERKIYFKERDQGRRRARAPPANNVATLNGTHDSGSGSETNAPQYEKPKLIEQGVDEILHLKMLESVLDAPVPGTMVLATGDAAQAEYSQGFMATAERALKAGWSVELVSWSKGISQTYYKRQWREAWGERFRIVLLDDYAEELLDM